jgi:TonB family protein
MRDEGNRRALILAGIGAMAVLIGPGTVRAQGQFAPARYIAGEPPGVWVEAVSGGEVFVEVAVTKAGHAGAVTALRAAPGFTEYVLATLRDWRFQPAFQMGAAVSADGVRIAPGPTQSKVLVACVFRPPVLIGPTFGEPSRDVRVAPDDVAFPMSTVTPPYPPLALADATVVVEVTVGITGNVLSASAVRSVPGFDEAALAAARQWKFRPARIHRLLEETLAYIVFVFRRPVTFVP